MTQTGLRAEALVTGRPPIRLHHNAYVTNDLAATGEFYEDVIGMPLVATWAEVAELVWCVVNTFTSGCAEEYGPCTWPRRWNCARAIGAGWIH
jgi:catechol 2,3-dioxygenase-like lactoylglutathione lyase family enzyme